MEKFEIGDKVQVTKLDTTWYAYLPSMKDYLGKTGTIKTLIEIDTDELGATVLFDEDGKTIARVLPIDWLKLIEKAPKYWTGKIVITDSGRSKYFTVGKVYSVKDGSVYDDSHSSYWWRRRFTSVDNIQYAFDADDYGIKCIEFKGYAEEE